MIAIALFVAFSIKDVLTLRDSVCPLTAGVSVDTAPAALAT